MKRKSPPLRGTPPLPPGTQVRRLHGGQLGTVRTTHNIGTFSVEWPGGVWEVCGTGDVRAVTAETARAVTASSGA